MNEMINEALRSYGMTNARYELIRHNENLTYRVDHGGDLFALRIRCPAEGLCSSFITGDISEADRQGEKFPIYQSINRRRRYVYLGRGGR